MSVIVAAVCTSVLLGGIVAALRLSDKRSKRNSVASVVIPISRKRKKRRKK